MTRGPRFLSEVRAIRSPDDLVGEWRITNTEELAQLIAIFREVAGCGGHHFRFKDFRDARPAG